MEVKTCTKTYNVCNEFVAINEGYRRAKLIDLSKIEIKLRSPEGSLKNKSEFEVKLAVSLYREFLALNYAYRQKRIIPTQLIDCVWHAHILDTLAYAKDCVYIYGEFLHHNPYFGLNGPEDEKCLIEAYEQTCSLWKNHFKHRPDFCATFNNSARCGNSCSSCSR